MREWEMVGPKTGLLRLAAVALSPAYFRQRLSVDGFAPTAVVPAPRLAAALVKRL
jgi:hypothetical protein